MDKHIDDLLVTLSNYHKLPKEKQAELRPLVDETIERAKQNQNSHKVISGFVNNLEYLSRISRLNDEIGRYRGEQNE